MVISPYQVIIVKSLGYNLWKGNNQLSTVEGYGKLEIEEFKNLHSKVKNIKKNKNYEINWDNIFLDEAIYNIEKKPYQIYKIIF